jgi:hypothetical protein
MRVTDIPLEDLIATAGRTLRSLSWHSDGRVFAKSGAGAKYPRKLYSAKTPHEAIAKLIGENGESPVGATNDGVK